MGDTYGVRMSIARLTLASVAVLLCSASSIALAEPKVSITPTNVRPGAAVLVRVTGMTDTPKGKVGATALDFYAARKGHEAVVAMPIDQAPGEVLVHIEGMTKHAKLKVRAVKWPEAKVVVQEEMANPPAAERARIDADNKAMLDALRKADMAPRFTRGFRKPGGRVSSSYGEWRTFNDGHRSQHLGFDVAVRLGSPVKAINAGTVTLVRDTFLAGHVVVIAHGGGVGSAYFHLKDANVTEGQEVAAGALIGRAGETGRTTGPHLHLSVRVPGGFVDPQAFFRLRLSPAAPKPEAKAAAQAPATK